METELDPRSEPALPAWLDRGAYPFRSRWLALPAGRVHYVDEGEGDPIVFSHGTPTWSFEYRHLIRALRERHRCIAPDHLGFGLSERPGGFGYRPEDHAEVLRAFVDGLGLDRFSLVVHDFGGPIALPLALAGRVTRLVVLNTWMWPFDDDPRMRRLGRMSASFVGRLLYRHANASLRIITPSAYGDRERLTPEIHAQYLEVFRDKDAREDVLWALARALNGSRDFYAGQWEARERLREIPTALVWGLADHAFGPAFLARWREVLPDAQVSAIEHAGHWPHEEAPDEVLLAIRRRLEAD